MHAVYHYGLRLGLVFGFDLVSKKCTSFRCRCHSPDFRTPQPSLITYRAAKWICLLQYISAHGMGMLLRDKFSWLAAFVAFSSWRRIGPWAGKGEGEFRFWISTRCVWKRCQLLPGERAPYSVLIESARIWGNSAVARYVDRALNTCECRGLESQLSSGNEFSPGAHAWKDGVRRGVFGLKNLIRNNQSINKNLYRASYRALTERSLTA